jgi:hypothetical protein
VLGVLACAILLPRFADYDARTGANHTP